jgi:formamidopyrimidine-DNA glycosylase
LGYNLCNLQRITKDKVPELPEVQNLINTLAPKIVGATIASASVLCDMSIARPSPEDFAHLVVGRKVLGIGRRGKYLVFELDSGWYLVAHLRMTGKLLLQEAGTPAPGWARVAFCLADGRTVWFSDIRKFGRLAMTRDPQEVITELGPEPLDPCLDEPSFHARMAGRRRPIKTLLLDQAFIAGLGNIYADESLYEAGINPLTPAGELDHAQAAILLASIRSVLERAIANRGTTFRDYVDAEGRRGGNQEHLSVYGRGGQSCPRCRASIERTRLAGRSTCYCPRCQPLADPNSGPAGSERAEPS